MLLHELAWFEAANENILATIVVDTDDEFAGMILAKDLKQRFRWIASTDFYESPEEAVYDLHNRLARLLPQLDEQRIQGDEKGQAIDFFMPLAHKEKRHPHFLQLSSGEGMLAARGIISVMMRWHEDIDGNFVEQFQTTGFDARIWELYLFAALAEAGLDVESPSPAPDFLVRGPHGEFTLEATTINRSLGPDGQPAASRRPRDEADIEAYVRHYLPIRYAGPLTAKLRKEYWTKAPAADKPMVFAIQDFHDTMSMTYSGIALPTYLYGYTYEARHDANGDLSVVAQVITEHQWEKKTIPSGFFSLEGSENVSAVIFNNGGTLSKFNRMGVSAGFGSDNVVLIRQGFNVDPDPEASEPVPYVHFVGTDHAETWIEGMDVYHNPRAIRPLDPQLLPGAAHHRLLADGQIETVSPTWNPRQSRTSVLVLPEREQAMDANAPSES